MISQSNLWLARLIRLIHYLLIAFVLLGPLATNPMILSYHFQLVIFLFFKWFFRRGKCGLTEFEYRLRGIPEDQGFVYRILQPIVDLSEKEFNWCCYTLVIMLGTISYARWLELSKAP